MRTHLLFLLLLPVLALCACASHNAPSAAVVQPVVQSCGFTSDDPELEREHQRRHEAIEFLSDIVNSSCL